MKEEKVITLTEFKTVMEEVNSNYKKIMEVMEHKFSRVDEKFENIDKRFDKIDADILSIKADVYSVKEQIGLLHEGQTEIKNELKQKADHLELAKLEKRVARLEHKVA